MYSPIAEPFNMVQLFVKKYQQVQYFTTFKFKCSNIQQITANEGFIS